MTKKFPLNIWLGEKKLFFLCYVFFKHSSVLVMYNALNIVYCVMQQLCTKIVDILVKLISIKNFRELKKLTK